MNIESGSQHRGNFFFIQMPIQWRAKLLKHARQLGLSLYHQQNQSVFKKNSNHHSCIRNMSSWPEQWPSRRLTIDSNEQVATYPKFSSKGNLQRKKMITWLTNPSNYIGSPSPSGAVLRSFSSFKALNGQRPIYLAEMLVPCPTANKIWGYVIICSLFQIECEINVQSINQWVPYPSGILEIYAHALCWPPCWPWLLLN